MTTMDAPAAAAAAAPFVRLLLVRHGESTNNNLMATSRDLYVRSRVPDAPLTERGRDQARRVGAALAACTVPVQHLYTSAMARALETAAIAAAAAAAAASPTPPPHPLRPRVWTAVHEAGGLFEKAPAGDGGASGATYVGVQGLDADAMRRAFPAAVLPTDGSVPGADGAAKGDGIAAGGGEGAPGWWGRRPRETLEQCHVRARAVIARIKAWAMHLAFLRSAALAASGGGDASWSCPIDGVDLRYDPPSAAAAATSVVTAEGAIAATRVVAPALSAAAGSGGLVETEEGSLAGERTPAAPTPALAAVRGVEGCGTATTTATAASAAHALAAAHAAARRYHAAQGALLLCAAIVTHGDFLDALLHTVMADTGDGDSGRPIGSGAEADTPLEGSSAGIASTASVDPSLPLPVRSQWFVSHYNCAITALDVYDDGAVRLVCVNKHEHLLGPDSSLVTGGPLL